MKRKYNINPHEPSSEEVYIARYFDDVGIKYEEEKVLPKLKGDEKSYRKVDFYLPKYDIYVEYFGLYNSTKDIRANYDEKVKVYLKNNVPSVFLYPHELGILDYAFHNKILKVMRKEKFKSRKNIFRYKINRYFEKGKSYFLPLAILSWYFTYAIDVTGEASEVNVSSALVIGCMIGSVYFSLYFLRNLFAYLVLDH